MSLPEGLKPERVWHFFKEISDIPRGSGNTKAVAEYLRAFADSRNLKSAVDEGGNVVIYADGTEGRKDAPAVILQGHIDMVAVKTPASTHDFTKDPLTLGMDGDMIYAEGTTLGGDDGIAVAYMLAILDDPSVSHPPLDCVFTNDEEIGMIGANALDMSCLRGTTMINLDSEDEGLFTVGCAGGVRIDTILPVKRVPIKGLPVVVLIDGLHGGHSGESISKGYASANILMSRFLYELDQKTAFSLEKVAGGEKDNAIANSAKAHLVIDEEDFPAVESYAAEFEKAVRREYIGADEGISVHISKGDVHRIRVIDPDCQQKVIYLMMNAPYGVVRMDTAVENTVQTSSNPGIVRTTDTEFICANLVRSMYQSAKQALVMKIRSMAEMAGAHVRVSESYGEWRFRQVSPLRDKMVSVFEEMYGKKPEIKVTHGGLECGLFSEKIRGIDIVSIGPDMKDIHTANERLSASSSERVYNYLLKVLEVI